MESTTSKWKALVWTYIFDLRSPLSSCAIMRNLCSETNPLVSPLFGNYVTLMIPLFYSEKNRFQNNNKH